MKKEKKIESLINIEGKVISYHVDKVLCPNNIESKREFVTHPGGVCILAINENNEVAMEKQYRYPYDKEIFELPAGKLEKNEDPLFAAYRELEEEIGYKANSLTYMGKMYPSVGYTNEIIYFYFTNDIVKTKTNLDEDEFIDVIWVNINELKKMIIENEICDAKTICLISKYLLIG